MATTKINWQEIAALSAERRGVITQITQLVKQYEIRPVELFERVPAEVRVAPKLKPAKKPKKPRAIKKKAPAQRTRRVFTDADKAKGVATVKSMLKDKKQWTDIEKATGVGEGTLRRWLAEAPAEKVKKAA